MEIVADSITLDLLPSDLTSKLPQNQFVQFSSNLCKPLSLAKQVVLFIARHPGRPSARIRVHHTQEGQYRLFPGKAVLRRKTCRTNIRILSNLDKVKRVGQNVFFWLQYKVAEVRANIPKSSLIPNTLEELSLSVESESYGSICANHQQSSQTHHS